MTAKTQQDFDICKYFCIFVIDFDTSLPNWQFRKEWHEN